ncbi:hypothetical protein COT97_04410 [Candidatus Falkowbacteria bacterium CG10_big_fil_rev_8_21_14_0_10_39_11]|uniref:Uncharacterized protein n=1 Tax=Candidatus Falkowbacteria bacterium CG10_big_fil_rev_8_21_14_0_10_39_11 TaxID=1974565 RepID=A0A2H0V606_9BACT|nr:MAG: hypothetical protein COT97_04410 [Candidatus Falkowbacteria bacterium CG10_big_fil_rev_8_21_14_0_10_39_11]
MKYQEQLAVSVTAHCLDATTDNIELLGKYLKFSLEFTKQLITRLLKSGHFLLPDQIVLIYLSASVENGITTFRLQLFLTSKIGTEDLGRFTFNQDENKTNNMISLLKEYLIFQREQIIHADNQLDLTAANAQNLALTVSISL